MIDDNFFSSLFSYVTSYEKKFSVRQLAKEVPSAYSKSLDSVMDMLTTTNIGKVMSDFAEEYGPDRKIDLVLSLSHKTFMQGVQKAKMSGVSISEKGIWKMNVNVPAQILVENSSGGGYELARELFMSLTFKAKLEMKDS